MINKRKKLILEGVDPDEIDKILQNKKRKHKKPEKQKDEESEINNDAKIKRKNIKKISNN